MSSANSSNGSSADNAGKHRAPRSSPRRAGLRAGIGVLAAGALVAVTAIVASADADTNPSSSSVGTFSHPGFGWRHLRLQPMPAAIVSFGRGNHGDLTVQLDAFGLTPGSSHTVELLGPKGSAAVAQFGTLTANSVGQGDAALQSTFTGSVPGGSRLVILNGNQGGSIADEPIAETWQLGPHVQWFPIQLTAVEVGPDGTSFGTPRGRARIVDDPSAKTITVTVNASGLTPGPHAAHIHLGSCFSQGPVLYALTDLVANSQGQIVNETRVVTGVTTPLPASGTYLNIHQGNSNNILQNGAPTINFRPLLCSDIESRYSR